MTNFEKITETPEALSAFLASLAVSDGPWDEAFHRRFRDKCQVENCDAENCPNNAKRNNPMWWLNRAVEEEQEAVNDRERVGVRLDKVLLLSYGKDSLARLGAIEELGWPLDHIVHVEVMATDR